MRWIRGFLFFVIVFAITFFLLEKKQIEPDEAIDNISHNISQKQKDFIEKSVPENIIVKQKFKGEIYRWIGKGTDELVDELGEPKRKDLSSYGYTWWIYTNNQTQYIQFGVKDDKIQTVYATGNDIHIEPLTIGDSYKSVNAELQFTEEVTYRQGIAAYTFFLDEEDLRMRPLVKLSDNIYAQVYFDTFTNKLSSIRVMTGDVLLLQRPYGLRYRGGLPELPNLTDKEWEKVENGMEKQIFDITNVIRNSFNKDILIWEEKVSEVAFSHSKDMSESNYFSHYSPDGDGLKERLEKKEIYYFAAGENIAAQYVDAPAAVEGWLNSKGHREALLHENYTHLGVGVYRLYYTQNFLTKSDE
ncbi:CAP domain-containing protein [Paucisalibacillus sp. EB02]|uniref:CAP domain-containing protein n=1 Tax=Paucisalibacillus sp. EB02 TaxID=1347087 RepID=UPI0004B115F9|nr:CAP domain-containing protein [Paucisalibacillus sp. EB02]